MALPCELAASPVVVTVEAVRIGRQDPPQWPPYTV
jgi:hypothetical protein